MPYTRQFFPEQHLLYQRVSGTLTTDEMVESLVSLNKIIEQAETPIHIIADMRSVGHFPTSLSNVKNLPVINDSPNLRWMIFIIKNPLLKFLASVGMQIIFRHARYRIFNSMDETAAFLEEMDSALDLHELFLEIEKQY